jgi:hypothetical protein
MGIASVRSSSHEDLITVLHLLFSFGWLVFSAEELCHAAVPCAFSCYHHERSFHRTRGMSKKVLGRFHAQYDYVASGFFSGTELDP